VKESALPGGRWPPKLRKMKREGIAVNIAKLPELLRKS
jgi:hypothetical protein